MSVQGSVANPRSPDPYSEWTGEYRRYDLLKEFVIALIVVSVLSVVLALVFSSPDEASITLARWSKADPADFVTTSLSELDGSSGIATYGQPYNGTLDAAQKIGPVSLQRLGGVHIPIDTARDFIIKPLQIESVSNPELGRALAQYQAAAPDQRKAWTEAYGAALSKATFGGGVPRLPAGDYGPVATMMAAELKQARSGGLDGAVLLSDKQFYQTDFTAPLLFLSDGAYLERIAEAHHLLGGQWGMMNETGSWPGQPWLWLYTLWYQIPPFVSSGNADALIWGLMMVLTLLLILVPYIPGVRTLPRHLRLYRLIWRDYYRRVEQE